MRPIIYTLTIAVCLGAALVVSTPAPAQADEYWDGYWSWYDGSYQPYYSRQYYSRPTYYQPRYGYYPYDGNYYGGNYYGGPRYSREYYGTPRAGYQEFPGSGGQVRVGPLRFGWR